MPKKSKISETPLQVNEPVVEYGLPFDIRLSALIGLVRDGIKYSRFNQILTEIPFTLHEWAQFLHLSERTIQRYKLEKKTFDPIYSDKILQIIVLYKTGIEVFGNKLNFDTWLETKSLALGGVKPKELLDNTFGINLVMDELTSIEYGVLA